MASHGFLCFCPRCMGSSTSKKGTKKNRGGFKYGNTKPKPKPQRPAQRQTNKTHGTDRRGPGQR